MPPKRKILVELTLDKKGQILRELDEGKSQRILAEKYGVSKSTIGNIGAKKSEILKALEDNTPEGRKRKLRRTNFEDVNNAVLSFFQKCRTKNIPISGPLIQNKAKQVAEALNVQNFHASNGWLESFRSRNNIQFRVLCGESANVDYEAAENWKRRLPDILKDFAPDSQFNADETGLFYRQLPTKSLISKGEHCKGGKLAKERVSVLLCCSTTGEKLKPLVIGNAALPRVFRQNKIDPKSLPVKWTSNKKAWMTNQIFMDWLDSLNRQMKFQKRKIILLVDNATSHNINKEFSNITVKFLPPNLTSEIQPLDQGVIQKFKTNYRTKMLLSLINNVDQSQTGTELCKSITVLDAIRWIASSWDQIKEETIKKCFQRAGFPPSEEHVEQPPVLEDNLGDIVQNFPQDIQDDLLPAESLFKADDGIAVHEEIPDSADMIMEEVLREYGAQEFREFESDSEQEDEQPQVVITNEPPLTMKDALHHANELLRYVSEHQPCLLPDILNLKTKIEQEGAKIKIAKVKQTQLDTFFKKQ